MAPARDATAAAPVPAPPPPALEVSRANRSDSSQAEAKTAPPAASESDGFAAVAGGTVSATGPSQSPLLESALKKEKPDPDRLEESAGEARRSGQYARAAELYQLAAGARRSANDSSRAAWDLAHAVECLAAASKITEAGGVRAELLRSYPSEEGPRHAADRALG